MFTNHKRTRKTTKTKSGRAAASTFLKSAALRDGPTPSRGTAAADQGKNDKDHDGRSGSGSESQNILGSFARHKTAYRCVATDVEAKQPVSIVGPRRARAGERLRPGLAFVRLQARRVWRDEKEEIPH